MIRIVLSLTLCCLTFEVLAATTPSRADRGKILPAPDGQRFLFIIETSSSTGRAQAETEAALFDLIASGVYREMLPGDTYGLWTYNKEISAGEFPMQIWDSRNASQLGTIAAAYLSERDFEKSGDVKRMMATLQNVIHSVSNLNVFIVSNGDSPISGTPFDKAINSQYKELRRERRKTGKPFVTTLVVRDGWIIDSSVAISGTPIKLPERPAPVLAEKKPVPASPPPASAPPKVAAAPQPSSTAPPAAADATNSSTGQVQPPVVAARPKPRVIQIITKTNTVDTPPVAPPATLATTPAPADVNTAPAPQESNPAPTAPSTDPAPTVASSSPSPTVTPVVPPGELDTEPPPLESALAALLPQPLTVAARERQPDTDTGPGVVEPQPPAAVQATALPSGGSPNPGVLLAFGGLLLGAACFLLFIVFRRHRPAPQGSLITQSMNQR